MEWWNNLSTREKAMVAGGLLGAIFLLYSVYKSRTGTGLTAATTGPFTADVPSVGYPGSLSPVGTPSVDPYTGLPINPATGMVDPTQMGQYGTGIGSGGGSQIQTAPTPVPITVTIVDPYGNQLAAGTGNTDTTGASTVTPVSTVPTPTPQTTPMSIANNPPQQIAPTEPASLIAPTPMPSPSSAGFVIGVNTAPPTGAIASNGQFVPGALSTSEANSMVSTPVNHSTGSPGVVTGVAPSYAPSPSNGPGIITGFSHSPIIIPSPEPILPVAFGVTALSGGSGIDQLASQAPSVKGVASGLASYFGVAKQSPVQQTVQASGGVGGNQLFKSIMSGGLSATGGFGTPKGHLFAE